MKLVLFQTAAQVEPVPGLLTERGVVSLVGMVERSYTPQLTMQRLIDAFDGRRPALERQAAQAGAMPLGTCCCGRGPSKTRPSCSRPPRADGMRTAATPTAIHWSLTPGGVSWRKAIPSQAW